ncbi:MAG: DNA-binding Lrp family transcriptional regulator [Candidatus Azotimanducaceae bacterium]|jgi:DNA-binding Lrp family transcriptional regulator
MNSTDEKLLSLLLDNGRESTSALARKLSISRSTVQSKIKRLEESGVIQGYSAQLGDDYANKLVSAHVLITVHQKQTAQTNLKLSAIPQIRALFAISGDYDLIAVVRTETTEQLSSILDDIGNLEGVERTNSSLILETKLRR